MKKSTHSKIKNTGILFELLTRQVASDTMLGVEKSPALTIIREFFKPNTSLAKELLLYQSLIKEKYNNTEKAAYLLNTTLKLHKKLNKTSLKEQKYALIREIKKHYDLVEFFKTNINEYKVFASIYRIFEGVTAAKVAEVVKSRFTIIEHLTRSKTTETETKNAVIESYTAQDKEIRLLAYKLMIDKFNERYAGLSIKQKAILKEYINNISNTESLKNFMIKESQYVKTQLTKLAEKVKDKVVKIKLNEVTSLLEKYKKIKSVKEDHVLSLLLYHELLKELKHAK